MSFNLFIRCFGVDYNMKIVWSYGYMMIHLVLILLRFQISKQIKLIWFLFFAAMQFHSVLYIVLAIGNCWFGFKIFCNQKDIANKVGLFFTLSNIKGSPKLRVMDGIFHLHQETTFMSLFFYFFSFGVDLIFAILSDFLFLLP